MQYICRTPSGPLNDFVERFWMLSDAPGHLKERVVPSGTIELVVNLHENELRIYDPQGGRCRPLSGAVISGAYKHSFVIDTQEHASIVGIHFKPGGAFSFLGVEASELADIHIDLEALWGRSAIELRERLSTANTPAERFGLLEEALMAHLFRPLARHHAVLFALDTFGRADPDLAVRDVARYAGLSHRRFIQLFAREVGMSPKLFCRVRRFQLALETVRQTAVPDWSGLALDCGYYDQSHLIHDFRYFMNLSPTEFIRQRSETVMENHVPLAQ
jgi:AraC-like DNA-binding protein